MRNPDAYLLQMAVNVATDQYVDRLRQARPWHYADGAEAVLEQLADGAAGPATLAEVRSEVAARHGISLRSVDTLLRQALDHCAAHTGQTVIGGIGTARRALRTARAGFQPGPSSFAVAT